MPVRTGERGQATVELVGVLPLLAVLGFAVWQAAVVGQAFWMAGAAARAAARAEALRRGRPGAGTGCGCRCATAAASPFACACRRSWAAAHWGPRAPGRGSSRRHRD